MNGHTERPTAANGHCHRCRQLMRLETTWGGFVVSRCGCARLERGLCLDCPRRRLGQRTRCAACSVRHFRARHTRHCRRRYAQDREERLAYARAWYLTNRPAIVAARHAKRVERRMAAA